MLPTDAHGPFARGLHPAYARGLEVVKVLPGELYATQRRVMIVTVLGSCVAACIADPQARIAGMNHFMLPECPVQTSPVSHAARYGTHAMELLVNALVKLGARRERLEAKVFGAGAVFPGLSMGQVGERNAAFVLDYLATEAIPVISQDLGGVNARKVCMDSGAGVVHVQRLARADDSTIEVRDREYRSRLKSAPAGDVELFQPCR